MYLNIKQQGIDFRFDLSLNVLSKVLVTQSCLILSDPMDCSPPGSSVHGILQARILEWVAIPSSRGSSWPRDQTQVSCNAGRFFTVWATRRGMFKVVKKSHYFLPTQQTSFMLQKQQKKYNFRERERDSRMPRRHLPQWKMSLGGTGQGKQRESDF